MISNFYDTTFINERLEWLTDENDNQYSQYTEVGEFVGHIQQADQELVERFNLNFNTAYTIWCADDGDVLIGDIIKNEDDVYTVRAIQKNAYGRNAHLEVLAEGGGS